jgi:succinate dehydrogenase/fumarate reductase flavoprotein subunit
MGAVAFDTLKFAKRLKEAGFTEQQAEALAEAEAELFEAHLATKEDLAKLEHQAESIRTELKRDLEEVRAELKRDIAEVQRRIEEVRAELKRDLKDLEYRLVIKLGAMLVVAVGVVAALLTSSPA